MTPYPTQKGTTMLQKQNAKIAVKMTDSTRALFKLMNFHEIPEEATYVAFLDDGDAVFLQGEITRVGFTGFPHMAFITYETNLEVEYEE